MCEILMQSKKTKKKGSLRTEIWNLLLTDVGERRSQQSASRGWGGHGGGALVSVPAHFSLLPVAPTDWLPTGFQIVTTSPR